MLPLAAAVRLQGQARLAGSRVAQRIPSALRIASVSMARTRAFSLFPKAAYASSTSSEKVPLSSERYPYLKRDPTFKKLSQEDIDFFQSVLPPSAISQDDSDLEAFNVDWMHKFRGQSKLLLKPSSTEQVSKILKYCNDHKLAVVPQGGNTGLVGGGVPVFDEIILSTANMNSVRSFDEVSGALVCDAGCILEVLDNYLAERGYIMPLDLGAKGSCHIGGNVATNAGGLRLLRYGSLHGTVLGLEVVLADGTILDNLSTLRKDNTGYDLKQLFIGSEGTLGIVTGVSIMAPKRSKAVNVALLGVSSFEQVQAAYKRSRDELSEILSAFEFFDEASINLVKKHLVAGNNDPLESSHPFYVLIETSGSNKDHDDEKLTQYLEGLLTDEIVQDGVVAQDTTQYKNLWAIREGIPEACSKTGPVYKYDLSIPVPVFYNMVEDMRARLNDAGVIGEDKDVEAVVGFGHIGDGNLHLNIASKRYSDKVAKVIEPYVYEWTAKHSGSISSEHGLGVFKSPYLAYSKSSTMIDMMRRIKKMMDPQGIMNPYKYLPEEKK
ncbi:hypothetical protein BG015_010945 [Linnemannia schmuckeri]|uniref:D-2-hydroxyglutarate dehydrogenase, mitochondrial n=1 Tax=Linnemannia schmuckeri TaxID=64567 RepID=A0A9P5RTT6_9FUNG|nr:hypothetical protein BG015_010945 [Linnemannia schmuckeri]